jgi:hypothetical protein
MGRGGDKTGHACAIKGTTTDGSDGIFQNIDVVIQFFSVQWIFQYSNANK